MKINHETKLLLSIITDFNSTSLEKELIYESKIKVVEIIDFLDQLEKSDRVSTSVYENSFTVSFEKNIVCVNILHPTISWDDIITYKNIYNYYERM